MSGRVHFPTVVWLNLAGSDGSKVTEAGPPRAHRKEGLDPGLRAKKAPEPWTQGRAKSRAELGLLENGLER